jgi:hypothetical protein
VLFRCHDCEGAVALLATAESALATGKDPVSMFCWRIRNLEWTRPNGEHFAKARRRLVEYREFVKARTKSESAAVSAASALIDPKERPPPDG